MLAIHSSVSNMPRKQSGHSLYIAGERGRVMTEMKCNLKKGDKVRDDVASEADRRWNNLPKASQDIWKGRAGIKN